MAADVVLSVLVVLVVVVVVVVVQPRRRGQPPRPFIAVGGPKPKYLHPGTTTATWRTTVSQPPDTPFTHTTECKMQDATPEWYSIGDGHHERVCVCRKEISYPPMWTRPDILDPAIMQHESRCEIADKPELLKLGVTVKHERTYDFAWCRSCDRNWYAWDQPPAEAVTR